MGGLGALLNSLLFSASAIPSAPLLAVSSGALPSALTPMLATRKPTVRASRSTQCFAKSAHILAPVRTRKVSRSGAVSVRAAGDFGGNPVRSAIGGVVSGIYKLSAMSAQVDAGSSPLWAALTKLDLSGVRSAIQSGADVNERNASGDTPLLMIARAGHYKYPPAEIPAALVSAGADKEAKDKNGLTALQVSLLSGWQNIAELLIKSGADTSGVAPIKSRLTCPDCKALVLKYNL